MSSLLPDVIPYKNTNTTEWFYLGEGVKLEEC